MYFILISEANLEFAQEKENIYKVLETNSFVPTYFKISQRSKVYRKTPYKTMGTNYCRN